MWDKLRNYTVLPFEPNDALNYDITMTDLCEKQITCSIQNVHPTLMQSAPIGDSGT